MGFRYYYADRIREKMPGFRGTDEELQSAIDDVSLLYNSAIKELETRLNILSDDFDKKHSYMPIHHVQSRLKSFESIMEKAMRDVMFAAPKEAYMKGEREIVVTREMILSSGPNGPARAV